MAKKSEKKQAPKGCLIGCFGVILLIFAIGVIGFLSSPDSTSPDDKPDLNSVDGIEVTARLISNILEIDESMTEIKIKNTNDKSFVGEVSVYNTALLSADIEIDNLPPGKEIIKQQKHTYIKHPEDGYNYSISGELVDMSFDSGIDYQLFETENDKSFNIQTDVVNEQIVKKIIKELYSKKGPLTHVGIYDNTQVADFGENLPRANYFGGITQTITFYLDGEDSKEIEYDPANE